MPHLLYITTPTHAEATKIAKALVEEKLAACVNILPAVTSFFYWEGKLEEAQEVVLIAKTTKERVEALTNRVEALHSYSCPCVVAVPIEGGNPDFLRWVEASSTATSN